MKKRMISFVMVLILAFSYSNASAKVRYMPDVTAEMSKATYWSGKMPKPEKQLADWKTIEGINQAIADDSAVTYITDLKKWDKTTFNGEAMAASLTRAAEEDFKYFYSQDCKYDDAGTAYSSYEAIREAYFKQMIDNCADPDATSEMPVRFAICTTRTCVLSAPTLKPIWDSASDPDFDYLYQTMVRVNEPVVLQAKSADGRFYHVTTSCVSGWIDINDVAICKDKAEWLEAWDFDPSETLVVYDDKIYTETSNYAPEVSNVKLPMGTCLKLAADEETQGLINNRSANNNHVVWLPIRKEDGSYDKKLCLIGENRKVSEGFLPLTSANIAMVALNQLGDAYGWGGMMGSDDCSGYVRDVYKCFGLELARNTTWQADQPVKKYSLEKLSDEEKTEIIKRLPVGAILLFRGHEMMYLGCENDKLYVISSVSSAVVPPDTKVSRLRGTIINTLDIRRGNGNTWLTDLHTAEIPYMPLGSLKNIADDNISVKGLQSYTYNKKAHIPNIVIHDLAGTLSPDKDYTVSFANTVNAGQASVIIKGKGDYAGTLIKKYTINKGANSFSAKAKTASIKYNIIKKKGRILPRTKLIKITNKGQGKLTYQLVKVSGNKKYFKLNSKTGKLKIKKGLKKGKYKVRVRIHAAGDSNYQSLNKIVISTIKIK